MQVTILWPPQSPPPLLQSPQQAPPPQHQPPTQESFSSETLKILASLSSFSSQQSAATEPIAVASNAGQIGAEDVKGVRLEVLKHPLGVVGVQWSPASTPSGRLMP